LTQRDGRHVEARATLSASRLVRGSRNASCAIRASELLGEEGVQELAQDPGGAARPAQRPLLGLGQENPAWVGKLMTAPITLGDAIRTTPGLCVQRDRAITAT
jgi:hypothetical protein